MAYHHSFHPFNEYELSNVIQEREAYVNAEVERLSNDEILANSEEILADNLYERNRFIPVEILEEDINKRKSSMKKIKVQNSFAFAGEPPYFLVDGVLMDFYVPFKGDDILFKCRATKYSFSPLPDFSIENDYIHFQVEERIREGEETNTQKKLLLWLNEAVNSLRNEIQYANNDVNTFNSTLRNKALELIIRKKKKVLSFCTLSKMMQIPVKKTDFTKEHITIKRRIRPIEHVYNREPNYTVSDEDYKDILRAIKNIGTAIEQTPASYDNMKEEDLRNVFLGLLNVLYLGMATGETFRKGGKTDICIQAENLAAFVAECKMWEGQKKVEKAVEQLDKYLTWRDCKTALIFFVKLKNFISILDTAKKALSEIPNMRQVKEIDKNEFECSYDSVETPGQIVKIHCFLFNIEPGTSKR